MTDMNAMRAKLISTLKAAGGIHNPDVNAPHIADTILALLATGRAAGAGEFHSSLREMVTANFTPPAPADASGLDPLLCRCENARRKGIPMLCVQCTGPVGSQTPAGAN